MAPPLGKLAAAAAPGDVGVHRPNPPVDVQAAEDGPRVQVRAVVVVQILAEWIVQGLGVVPHHGFVVIPSTGVNGAVGS